MRTLGRNRGQSNSVRVMEETCCIALPLTHPASVNAWLLIGEPLTLIDTGPLSEDALRALERGLAEHGVRIEDLELVLATHHHHDHVGLAATIRRRSGAEIAVLDRVADYCDSFELHVAAERAYSHRVMAAHGVPAETIDDGEGFWRMLTDGAESFTADRRLRDGELLIAAGRTLEVVFRPGHSTTDTLFVDLDSGVAFVGDHLLADVSSNTEIYPADGEPCRRPHSRLEYLAKLRLTAGMRLERLLTGHGQPIDEHVGVIEARLHEHAQRCEQIVGLLACEPRSAYELAAGLWSSQTVREQPLLVVWEVLGHLDLLAGDGAVSEAVGPDGIHRFRLAGIPKHSFNSPIRSDHSAPVSADFV
jgi:glyoxylase-like metal-dependent hydrolase (beta-lactamase superfamily II)